MKKMRKYLAVTLGRCSGCSIFVDDKIVFSASEEDTLEKNQIKRILCMQ